MVQLLAALVILGVLGAFSLGKWTEYAGRSALKSEAKALSAFLQEARAHGQKRDLAAGVVFAPAGTECRMFEDRNRNGSADADEFIRTFRLANRISIGPPQDAPDKGPDGSAIPASGLEGAWANALVFPRDGMAGLAAGGLYLRRQRLGSHCVCIRGRTGSYQLDLSAWDGRTWSAL